MTSDEGRGTRIELAQGALRAEIGPDQGGRLLSFYSLVEAGERWDWMRPAPDAAAEPRECASFPLVPFSNRIADARFDFDGQTIVLPRNFPPEPHAIHGMGWEEDWEVQSRSESTLDLAFEESGDLSWPWAYRASQRFSLSEDGLRIDMAITNRAETAMPAGLGQHPYFPAHADTCLTLVADGLIEKDEHGLPDRVLKDDQTLDMLKEGDRLPQGLDTGLEGWTGTARIDWPDCGRALEITAPGVERAVFYSPIGRDYFCLEPVTHVTNALNGVPDGLTDSGGIKILQPGESLSLTVTFRPVF